METNKNKTCLHILIVWANASNYRNIIIEDIKKFFKIQHIFNVKWSQDLFLDNLTIFYAHSLQHKDKASLDKILKEKIHHCGIGDFTVVVFYDEHPIFSIRETTNGERLVNSRVFDRKIAYRKWTGGGHRVHASDDAWETNKDLTLLFGLNSQDFIKTYNTQSLIESNIFHNCLGVCGYSSISELFYVLNNSIKYVVLRNFSPLPENYTVEGHGDIDLLVENKNYVTYLTLAKSVFPQAYRVYHTIRIGGRDIPFDFRSVGDGYYDSLWEEHILANRVLQKDIFYIPSQIDLFYSLLYHAYIQKQNVNDDYKKILPLYSIKIGIEYKPEINDAIHILDTFMQQQGYEYIRPNDLSVIYNIKNLHCSSYAFRYGKTIKTLYVRDNTGTSLYSKVFEKKDSFVKVGDPRLINNEAKCLIELSSFNYFPNVLKWEKGERESAIEINRIIGSDAFSFLSDGKNISLSTAKCFIIECVEMLKILSSFCIIHRDFTPFNMLVNKKGGKISVYLIDFGWAIHMGKTEKKYFVKGLGNGYYEENDFSDFFALSVICERYFSSYPFSRKLIPILRRIKSSDYNDKQKISTTFSEIQTVLSPNISDILYSAIDFYHRFLMQHPIAYSLRIWIDQNIRQLTKGK